MNSIQSLRIDTVKLTERMIDMSPTQIRSWAAARGIDLGESSNPIEDTITSFLMTKSEYDELGEAGNQVIKQTVAEYQ